MSLFLRPTTVDLPRGGMSWEAVSGPCDLCREEQELYRLLDAPDALCRRCFGMWHG